MNHRFSKDELETELIALIREKKPESVKELLSLVQEKFSISEMQLAKSILEMESQEKLFLKPLPSITPSNLTGYLRTKAASWFWINLFLVIVGTSLVILTPENFLLAYARYTLGFIMVLWLPGYSFIKALFPKSNRNKDLNLTERVALSIGCSIALVVIVGLILIFTPWSLHLIPIVFSLFALTTILSSVAIVREYGILIKQSQTLHEVERAKPS